VLLGAKAKDQWERIRSLLAEEIYRKLDDLTHFSVWQEVALFDRS